MNTDVTTALLALASLREQAERDAREFCSCDFVFMAALLADFTRKQSQWWMLERIGQLLHPGQEISQSVPVLSKAGPAWMVETDYAGTVVLCHEDSRIWTGYDVRKIPLDIAHMSCNDRPSALAAILLHLEGK